MRNAVRGGGIDSVDLPGVSAGPGIHSDTNAVAEAYKNVPGTLLSNGNPSEVGRYATEDYRSRFNQPMQRTDKMDEEDLRKYQLMLGNLMLDYYRDWRSGGGY